MADQEPSPGLPDADGAPLDSNALLAELRARRMSRNRIMQELMRAGLTLDEATDTFDEGIPVRLARVGEAIVRAEPPPPPAPLKGIDGWLLFPAVGLVVRPPVCVYELVELSGALAALEAAHKPAGLHRVTAFAGVLLVAILLLDLITAFFFFRRKRAAPRLFVALLGLELATTAFAYQTAASMAPALVPGPLYLLGRATVVGVWIVYFLVSKRVRNTFVE